jgi:hypothetical protein
MPPTNAPKNCDVAYKPIAKPRLSALALEAMSEGRMASSALKAIKNKVKRMKNEV